MKLIAIVVFAFSLIGCAYDGVPLGVAVDKVSLKAYDGPELPLSNVALIKPVAAFNIVDIDGKYQLNAKTYVNGLRYVDYDIAVSPGAHMVKLTFVHGGVTSKDALDLPINVQAGHRYLIKNGATRLMTWRPVIEDVTNRQERWCVFANDRPEFKGC